MTHSNSDRERLKGEALQNNCPRCNNRWIIHDCPEISNSLHQHKWEIDKLAGFIRTAVEAVYIICRDCGEVRLVEVNKPTIAPLTK